MEVEDGLKWKLNRSGRWIEVEVRWKWKYDGSGSAMEVFNPRRACAARVTVLGLCVCLFVC